MNAADLRQAQLSGLKANGSGPVFMSTTIDTVCTDKHCARTAVEIAAHSELSCPGLR